MKQIRMRFVEKAAKKIESSAVYRKIFRGSNRLEKNLILLHPEEAPGTVIQRYHCKKIEEALKGMLLAGGLLMISLAATFVTNRNNLIDHVERPDYRQGKSIVDLQVRGESGTWRDLTVSVGEREYTKEQIEDFLSIAEEELDDCILGMNESEEHISYPLSFPSDLAEGAVDASYSTSDLSILDNSGMISEDYSDENGTIIEVRVTMLCQSVERILERSFYVYPLEKGDETAYRRGLENEIRKIEENSKEDAMIVLPGKYAGETLTYRRRSGRSLVLFSGLTLVIVLLLFAVKDERIQTEIVARNTQLLVDYPELVSKLTVFLRAGMTPKWAISKIVSDYENQQKERNGYRYAYEELRITYREILNGTSEERAYEDYGKRCLILPYMRLGGYLSQNVRSGNRRLVEVLRGEVTESNEERKRLAKKQGEIAGTKALLPMVLMLAVTIVLVIYPAFTSFRI